MGSPGNVQATFDLRSCLRCVASANLDMSMKGSIIVTIGTFLRNYLLFKVWYKCQLCTKKESIHVEMSKKRLPECTFCKSGRFFSGNHLKFNEILKLFC